MECWKTSKRAKCVGLVVGPIKRILGKREGNGVRMNWAGGWGPWKEFWGKKRRWKGYDVALIYQCGNWNIMKLSAICRYIGEKWPILWKYCGFDISPTCIVSEVVDTQYIDDILLIYLNIFILGWNLTDLEIEDLKRLVSSLVGVIFTPSFLDVRIWYLSYLGYFEYNFFC